MGEGVDPSFFSLVAAIASAVAAIMAAAATWFAPIRAAKISEQLRRDAESSSALRKEKERIFYMLMQGRGGQFTREVVSSFNLIDLVFADVPSVRDAWAELYGAYERATSLSEQRDKLTLLLRAMADHLSLSGSLRSADFERYYYPKGVQVEDDAKFAMNQRMIAQLNAEAIDLQKK